MLQFLMDNLDGSLGIFKLDGALVYSAFGVILAFVLAIYILRSIAVFTLAKRNDQVKKFAFMSWIPVLWIYPTALLAGKVMFFSKPFKNFAVVITVLFVVSEVLALAYFILCYFPLIGYYLQGGTITFYTGMEATRAQLMELGYQPYYFDSTLTVLTGGGGLNIVYPIANLQLYGKILTIISLVSDVLSLVTVLFTIFMYVALFRRYFPKHFVIATVLSVLWSWIFPIFLFVVRKNKPVNYNDFLRERYNRMYYGHYNNPVNNGNPNYGSQPESPFEGFEDKDKEDPGDPFDNN